MTRLYQMINEAEKPIFATRAETGFDFREVIAEIDADKSFTYLSPFAQLYILDCFVTITTSLSEDTSCGIDFNGLVDQVVMDNTKLCRELDVIFNYLKNALDPKRGFSITQFY